MVSISFAICVMISVCSSSCTKIYVLSIYKFGLSVWVSVCLYPINVKTAEPIGLNFFVGPHVTPG